MSSTIGHWLAGVAGVAGVPSANRMLGGLPILTVVGPVDPQRVLNGVMRDCRQLTVGAGSLPTRS